MNSFGRIFRVSVWGESHGNSVGVVIDGCPAGMLLDRKEFKEDLQRRKGGGVGKTGRIEKDMPDFISGVFKEKTTGAPIMITFDNVDQNSDSYETLRYTPRPGHADFTAFQKYGGVNDYRGGGHFSGRITVGVVAAGVIAKKIISPVTIEAYLVEAGGFVDPEKAIREAQKKSESIGGIVECRAKNIPVGLGEPFFDSIESLISHGIFSIPAIKGIEFGSGFASTRMFGSSCNDEFVDITGKTVTNNSGGVAGGITNGNELVFRVAVKPTPSVKKLQKTVDMKTGKAVLISIKGNHDQCIALRIPVIVEAICACVLADCLLIEHLVPRIRYN